MEVELDQLSSQELIELLAKKNIVPSLNIQKNDRTQLLVIAKAVKHLDYVGRNYKEYWLYNRIDKSGINKSRITRTTMLNMLKPLVPISAEASFDELATELAKLITLAQKPGALDELRAENSSRYIKTPAGKLVKPTKIDYIADNFPLVRIDDLSHVTLAKLQAKHQKYAELQHNLETGVIGPRQPEYWMSIRVHEGNLVDRKYIIEQLTGRDTSVDVSTRDSTVSLAAKLASVYWKPCQYVPREAVDPRPATPVEPSSDPRDESYWMRYSKAELEQELLDRNMIVPNRISAEIMRNLLVNSVYDKLTPSMPEYWSRRYGAHNGRPITKELMIATLKEIDSKNTGYTHTSIEVLAMTLASKFRGHT